MKKILLLFAAVFTAFSVYSQQPIEINRKGGENMFYMNGVRLKHSEVKQIVSVNAQSAKLMSQASTNYTFGMIFAVAGGFMVGWPLGTAIGGGDPNWALLGAGAGILVLDFAIFIPAYNRKSRAAVAAYNSSLQADITRPRGHFALTCSDNGMGLAWKF